MALRGLPPNQALQCDGVAFGATAPELRRWALRGYS